MNSYQQLKSILTRIYHLQNIQYTIVWDESVMMPEGAGPTRGKVLGTLNRLIQKMYIQKKMKRLIESVKNEDSLSAWDLANFQWIEKQFKMASSIPLKLTEKFTEASFVSQQMWRTLRSQNNWQAFCPYLENTFKLAKEIATRKSEKMSLPLYDVLLDEYAPGFNQNAIDNIFKELKGELPKLIEKIIQQQSIEKVTIPSGIFKITKQKQLANFIAKKLGFNLKYGRIDVSHHPFSIGDRTDARITNRYSESDFMSSVFGICHETGHALYEQGLPKQWQFQPVGHANSMAMHESQSLLYEMEVCRSFEFFAYLSPILEKKFNHHESLNADNLYKVITRVKPGLIRVDADEVTYPLHIILRFELEKEWLAGEINTDDLPARWDELMIRYLGISTKNNDANGVMQDVHWPSGAFGYFPAYTLGRLIAAQLYSTYIKTHPDFCTNIKLGQFQSLNHWLQRNVYDVASSLPTTTLIQKITGEKLNPSYFIERIKKRYLEVNIK